MFVAIFLTIAASAAAIRMLIPALSSFRGFGKKLPGRSGRLPPGREKPSIVEGFRVPIDPTSSVGPAVAVHEDIFGGHRMKGGDEKLVGQERRVLAQGHLVGQHVFGIHMLLDEFRTGAGKAR